jgi:hypothetical protein
MITQSIQWIAVADQLPDDDMTVLIADTENDVTLGFHDGDAGWRYCNAALVGDPVTHWAELPDGPNADMEAPPRKTPNQEEG